MDRIRVATANMSRLLSDMVRQGLGAEGDLDLVAEIGDDADALLAEVDRANVDVLVVGLENQRLPSRYGRMMLQRPDVHVLGLSADAREAFAWELRPVRIALGEASPAALAAAVRAIARPRVA